MGLKITFAVEGGTELLRTLAVKTSAIKNLIPAWDQIETKVQAFQKRVFLNKGADGGLSAWKPLKESTRRGKSRDGYGQWANHPLIRTQALFKSWTTPNGPASVRYKEPLFFAMGVDEGQLPYAKFHQFGTRHMPAREHLRFPDQLRRDIVKIIQRHLVETKQFVRETRTIFG